MIGYTKYSICNELKLNLKQYHFEGVQNYIPIYNEFFKLNSTNFNSIQLSHPYYLSNIDSYGLYPHTYNTRVRNSATGKLRTAEMFIKEAPILDPFKLLTGELRNQLDLVTKLPDIRADSTLFPKMLNPYNASYVDGLFNYINGLMREDGFIHGVEFYGSFLAIKNNYTFNITEDLMYLIHSKYFKQNIDKLYTISRNIFDVPKLDITPYTKNTEDTPFEDIIDITADEPEEINTDSVDIPEYDESMVEQIDPKSTHMVDNSDIDSISTISDEASENEDELISIGKIIHNAGLDIDTLENMDDTSTICSEEDSETSSYSDSEPEDIFATIPKFPVHMICIEQCVDTLDSLLIGNELNEEELFSCMFQIIMILITYQKSFGFTHNDLHTNNIVFTDTNKKFILYTYHNVQYKVPTYGKIYKIIDFGRSIYTIHGRLICGDSYNKKEDAYSQYNFGPCYNPNHPLVEPNYSFDLCRLACSMIDIFIPDSDAITHITPFSRLILQLCTDDKGKYVLYKKTNTERYPEFKLYKMIARTVHAHTPENVMTMECFQKYLYIDGAGPTKSTCMVNIDEFINKVKNWGHP